MTGKQNFFIGQYEDLYWGYTTNSKIREKASGGGIVSDILISALKKGLIDGAVVTKINLKTLKAEYFIAKTPDEILSAAGSKYVLASNLDILKSLKTGNYAFVGLPCQIQALRKMRAEGFDWAKRIKYVIGLFCGSSMDNDVIRFLLDKLKIKNNILDIQFRSRDNSRASSFGGFMVETSASKKYIDKENYGFLRHLFMNDACNFCSDQTNELSDISVGDFWLKRKYDKKLPSSIIVRTDAGKKLLKNSTTLNLNHLSLNDLINCEFDLLLNKKIRIFIRRKKPLPFAKMNAYNNMMIRGGYFPDLLPFEIIWLNLLKLRKTWVGKFLLNSLPLGFWKHSISILYKIHNFYIRKRLLVNG